MSFDNLINILRRSRETMDFSKLANFLSCPLIPAVITNSKIFRVSVSSFCPRL